MSKKILTYLFIIFYILIITLSSIFTIKPGIDKLNYSKSIKELSYKDITNLSLEINNKYDDLELEINNKYELIIKDKEEEYKLLEEELSNTFEEKKKDIQKQLNSIKLKQNNEFFSNGFSEKYYELQSEYSLKYEEYSNINIEENKQKYDNELKKNKDIDNINNNKNNEIKELNNNKDNELESIKNTNTFKKNIRNKGIIYIVIGIILILLPSIYIVITYNKLIHLYNGVKEKWSQVDIYLKKRVDLIPNIVNSIKGSASFEKDTLINITKARNIAFKAKDKKEEIAANEVLCESIKSLLILHEDYPELKTNINFMNLQNDLREIEENIAKSRTLYNKAVLNYKNKLDTFPSNIVGVLFRFKDELFFEIKEEEKVNNEVEF